MFQPLHTVSYIGIGYRKIYQEKTDLILFTISHTGFLAFFVQANWLNYVVVGQYPIPLVAIP